MKSARIIVSVLMLLLLHLIVAQASNAPQKATPAQPQGVADTSKSAPSNAPVKRVDWHPYDDGLALARKSNKFMLIQFTSKSCGYCRKMEAESFSRPEVIDMLNKNFVPVRVWGDSDSLLSVDGYKISERQYSVSKGITGFPTFFVEAPTRESLVSFIGYRDMPTLMQYLDQVKTYIDTAQALKRPASKSTGK